MFNQITDKSNRIIRKYKKGAIVFNEGDSTQEMFIIKKGEVSIEKKLDDRTDNTVQLTLLKKGNFFGNIIMFHHVCENIEDFSATSLCCIGRENIEIFFGNMIMLHRTWENLEFLAT